MKYKLVFLFLFFFINGFCQQHEIIPLEGIWKFKLDPFNTGISSNGIQILPQLPEEITLPGSTDQAGKGYKTEGMTSLRLTRSFEYKGAAWYEKEIFIPENWKNKEVQVFLERAHWQTDVWINNQPAGKRESLSVPHVYSISSLIIPGKKNSIRIRVDNNMIYDIEYSHATSAETQTNWNGIIGKIELRAFDKVHIEDIRLYPNIKEHNAKFKITILNQLKTSVKGTLQFSGTTTNTNNSQQIAAKSIEFSGTDSLIVVSDELPLGNEIQTWDEFHPALYKIAVSLHTEQNGIKNEDSRFVTFGMREFSTEATHFTLNDHPIFIRSTVNSAEFPLTGYPSMELSSWIHILKTAKGYGLNAMRFHSWCPPEAAFEVADLLGMYLQVENSDWRFTIGKDSSVNHFLTEEADRILKTYGNHPSFAMFCEGNELVGPGVIPFLSGLVTKWKKEDPRHLYTGSSGYPVVPENDYNDFYGPRPQHWKEELKGRFNVRPLDTKYDYANDVAKFKIPLITHEVGQWCVYPDFNEIPKYTGVLKPYNYELFRESLREHNMLDQAEQFTMASGKFQVIQKKEEVESYLRTPAIGGYTLLQLQDFPGQGTAPVGVVDIFWDPKRYVTAMEFNKFNAARVPLLRTGSFTWTNDQTFKGAIEFSNFGESAMNDITVHWMIQYPNKQIFAEGDFDKKNIPVGSPIAIGDLSISLNKITEATQLNLIVTVPRTDCSNQWSIWVYPKQLPDINLKGIMIAYDWNNKVKTFLQQGGKVLLIADTSKIAMAADPVFSGISWNTVWSGMPPNLLGILCNPKHAALKDFPTEYYSNWQWWDVVRNSKPVILDHTPSQFKPLVQMIPDWNNPHKIGLVFEAKIGKGKLLFTSIDLKNNLDQRPVAKQFLYSLEKYITSNEFEPAEELSVDMVDELFKK